MTAANAISLIKYKNAKIRLKKTPSISNDSSKTAAVEFSLEDVGVLLSFAGFAIHRFRGLDCSLIITSSMLSWRKIVASND